MAVKRSKQTQENGPRPAGQAFPIVAVGASAGGIEAFTTLLRNLPDSPEMAFILILHQDPKHESNLAQILLRATKMPVEVIKPGVPLQSNHVYVAPPGAEVSVANGVLNLQARATGAPSVIDGFFRSLAGDQGSRAISVVLSGSASDGALGTREIKAEGGITFAQDDSAKMDSMPRSAIAAGFVDFVLPPEKIAAELVRMGKEGQLADTGLREPEMAKLFATIRSKHDIDFTHYKPTTIERRIRRRMALRRVAGLGEYLAILRDDADEIEQLYADILIRVTGFFRDPQVFATLQHDVFPELIRWRSESGGIRVWVPGCATGEEVYSIAMALLETVSESSSPCPAQIFGTDLSEPAIQRARSGVYAESIAAEVSPERLRRFFSPSDGGFRVNQAIRDCCVFARQNVTKDPPFSKLDLISCRNLMIYFGTALQKKVLTLFHYALRPDGYLLLGSAETVGNLGDLFGIVDRKHKIYRKKAVTIRPRVDFSMNEGQVPPQRNHSREEYRSPDGLFREADRLLLTRFSPAGVVINENMDVLQFRGRTSRYLEPPSGTASFNLLKMAREGLLPTLRSAIHNARKSNAPERREGVRVGLNDHSINVNLEVIPFRGSSNERLFVVLFQEEEEKKSARQKKKAKEEPAEPESRKLVRLKAELEATREYLQSIIEDQETLNEEMRAANEEIQSSNEELQSTNEELETAKEELQSTNEELTTLNEELENRNQELAQANNDLVNLLSSVEIPIIMLDGALRIRRFNPAAQRSLNLIPADVGRPFNDLKTTLQMDNLQKLIGEVIETLEVREVEVKDRSGRWQSLRIRPYRTTDNKIDGAVLALVYLDEFRRTSQVPNA